MTLQTSAPAELAPRIDRRRYWRVLRFFAGMILNVIWWEVILKRLRGERFVARGRSARMVRYARAFRQLAVQMGGVMIKLGQFVSARLDVMPAEITDELAGLQDEVPPDPLDDMLRVAEAELGAPAATVFAEFDEDVLAAASLGQVYRARLADGKRVAVKIQRPGIENLVATDLAALSRVARWVMIWKPVRDHANVPALLDEFAETLWQELDYVAEAGHAERFRQLLANDPRVYVPRIYRDYSTRRVLTLEDVTSIKITDYAAIEAAGVSRALAASYLLDIYLRMIFDFGYFHADPHPGNLFIHPLPERAGTAMQMRLRGENSRPFVIVFIDFGMVGRISEQTKDSLRRLLIAVATRDSASMMNSYQELGLLLPGADLDLIAQVEEEALDMVYGRSVPELVRMEQSEVREFAHKYRQLAFEMPFQVPQDFIYLVRAVGILSGLCTGLDPAFNPWEPLANYARKLLPKDVKSGVQTFMQGTLGLGQAALGLPRQIQNTLDRIEHGNLRARVTADIELKQDLRRVERAVNGMTRALIFSSVLVAGTLLTITGYQTAGIAAFVVAGGAFLSLLFRRRR